TQRWFQWLGIQLQAWLARVPIMKLRGSLLEDSKFSLNFLVLLISSCLIATFGLMINSMAVIIGAMIIAPLMLPLRGFAFAAIEGDRELLRISAVSISLGTLLGILVSAAAGFLIGIPAFGSEVLTRTQPTLIDLMIAIVAGAVSSYAKIRPEVGDAIPGTAIAVALMPPLCVVGLTLSQGQWNYCSGAFLLYCTNLLGINLACTLVYALAGYTRPDNEFSRTLSWGVGVILMVILIIPLGVSSLRLVRQSRLNHSIQTIISSSAVLSRQDIELIETRIFWRSSTIELVVRSVETITPDEVDIVEEAIALEAGRPFAIIFNVTQVTKVSPPYNDTDIP
ncbi:MAG: DUF389 domain-containing protein, partial [Leptolyngbyaceae bacterium]|nr:DUF389 domain-containing protein [Leptolyngbyaceae bacterium]